ncbi:adenosylcobinamide-GDP ribazoletransferase [Furfurilactobacillus entadae]|uniref:adenosylcobinamide-GDP ribazoletransferase n=1 Tax=Furfurilactobacillus entadae TaxID=2922307 RepID=UPI0035E6CC4A
MIQTLILFTQFFTRIPVNVAIDEPVKKFRQGVQYITLFGVCLGLLEGGLFWLLTLVFPKAFAWALVVMSDGLVTGGFHLDALADTADGLFSARTVERMKTIMKDSRLGTMGSLALLYYYIILIGAGWVLAQHQSAIQLTGIMIALPVVAKAGLSLLFIRMHYAGNSGGLAEMWEGIAGWQIFVAELVAGLAIFGLTGLWGLVSYLGVMLVSWAYHHHITKLFGGFTGDTLGAYACLSQIVFILIETGLVVKLCG